MEHTVYNYSLCMALALMLFFAFDFLIGKAPIQISKEFASMVETRMALLKV